MSEHLSESREAMPNRMRPRIAITMGDPNGVGPEVVLKCLADARMLKFMRPVIVGSEHAMRHHAERLGMRVGIFRAVKQLTDEAWGDEDVLFLDVDEPDGFQVTFGQIESGAGKLAMTSVARAVDLCMDGSVDAMVTAPISKEAISRAGYRDPGHTEFIAKRTGSPSHTMMMVSETLRVGLVTGHVAVWDVPKGVTREAILEKVDIIDASLQRDFGIVRPKIAVLGLNPHAGDGGIMGKEEVDSIIPAIREACDRGRLVFGPFPADGFFAIGGYRLYDAVLAMYHDQGLIPFKTLAFESGVNFTAGLPIVRTSPDHGTAFNIAGEGKASPTSMRSAIYVAIDTARRRVNYPVEQATESDGAG